MTVEEARAQRIGVIAMMAAAIFGQMTEDEAKAVTKAGLSPLYASAKMAADLYLAVEALEGKAVQNV